MHSRRNILETAALLAGGAILGASGRPGAALADPTKAQNEAAKVAQSGPLLTRPIPSTGEQIPIIGAGTSGSYDVAPDSPEYAQLTQVLRTFFDGGAKLIDTAPSYGRSEDNVGQLLQDGGWRSRALLATKIGADDRASGEADWAQSLRRLRTDKVDVLLVHNMRAWRHQLPLARELKAQGKVRYVGVTHYLDSGLAEMEQLLRTEPMDVIQIHYSAASRAAADRVLPLAQERGVAVMINRAFDDGRLFSRVRDKPLPAWAPEINATSWAQLFLKFALSQPAVTVVIPATGKPERQADNLRAGVGAMLTAEQQRDVIEAVA